MYLVLFFNYGAKPLLQKDKCAVICRFSRGHSPFVLRSPACLPAVCAPTGTGKHPPKFRSSSHLVVPPKAGAGA